eukprot:224541_1
MPLQQFFVFQHANDQLYIKYKNNDGIVLCDSFDNHNSVIINYEKGELIVNNMHAFPMVFWNKFKRGYVKYCWTVFEMFENYIFEVNVLLYGEYDLVQVTVQMLLNNFYVSWEINSPPFEFDNIKNICLAQ